MINDMATDTSIVNSALETGKNISEFGMLAVTAGFFLVLSALMMITYFRWFMKIVNDMLTNQKATMQELLNSTRTQNNQLADIAEGIIPETQARVKVIANLAFDLASEKVMKLIKQVRDENHIENKEATERKVRQLLLNIFDDRNSKFDAFTYRGRKLSSYTDPAWIDEISRVVLNELYNDKGPSDARAYSNISMVYNRIKVEFYQHMTGD